MTRLSRRSLRLWAIGVISALTVWLGFAGVVTNSFLHPVRRPLTVNPAATHVPCEDVRFPSAAPDQTDLSGWLIPADGLPKGVVILCHGRGGNRESVLPHAVYLRKVGFTCLLFDFRCCGVSGGDTSTLGWHEAEDVSGAVAFVKGRPELSGLPLGALGVSMGAASALQAAAKSDDIQAVVADCSYATLTRAVRQRFRGFLGGAYGLLYFPVRFLGQRALGINTDDVSPLEAVKHLGNRPVLFIHGTDDVTILPEDSQLLYAAASGPKELWLVRGVPHARSYPYHEQEYRDKVTAFFLKTLSR